MPWFGTTVAQEKDLNDFSNVFTIQSQETDDEDISDNERYPTIEVIKQFVNFSPLKWDVCGRRVTSAQRGK